MKKPRAGHRDSTGLGKTLSSSRRSSGPATRVRISVRVEFEPAGPFSQPARMTAIRTAAEAATEEPSASPRIPDTNCAPGLPEGSSLSALRHPIRRATQSQPASAFNGLSGQGPGKPGLYKCSVQRAVLILVFSGVSIFVMRRALTPMLIWLVLAACFVCPVTQMFDHWDHELKTGQDTETTFVVLALCIGATFVLSRAAAYVFRALRVQVIRAQKVFHDLLETRGSLGAAPFLAASPPLAILRI